MRDIAKGRSEFGCGLREVDIMRAKRNVIAIAVGGLAVAGIAAGAAQPARAEYAAATIVELTQTGCQFLEAEHGVDYRFKPARKEDCVAINARTAHARKSQARVLTLKPGRYVFRITNRDVPYEVGFSLRGQGLGVVTLPSVSGGGIPKGKTRDFDVMLKPGLYYYSSPENPTPRYQIRIEG